MASTGFRLFFIVVLLLFLEGDALRVQIFKDLNYKGLIYEHNSDGTGCIDIKDYGRGEAGSLKTDTCLILYDSLSCTGNSFKLSRDMKDKLENLRRPIYSFHTCNATHGGDIVRLEMFSSTKLIAKYKNICGCQDLPSQVTTGLKSLNNFGNCVVVYSDSKCGKDAREIEAGQNSLTQDLTQLNFYIRSVSACGERRKCVRLKSEIFKLTFNLDKSKTAAKPKSKMLDLASKTTFYNNGSATVFQEFEARKKIRESTTVGFSQEITTMADSSVNDEILSHDESVSGPDFGFVKATTKVTETVKATYEKEKTEKEKDSGSYTHEVETEFAVRQVVEVPPCVQYEVFSTVEVVENLPIVYDLYTKITGESSGVRMSAEEVATQVDELTFVEIIDEYTAVYKSTHSMVANIGVDTKISGEGKPLPGCKH